jgi:hypothetical protein
MESLRDINILEIAVMDSEAITGMIGPIVRLAKLKGMGGTCFWAKPQAILLMQKYQGHYWKS